MVESRTKNAVKNILFGTVNKVVNLLLPFISRTVIMYVLGSEFLGLGSLFTSVLQMLNMTELGFSSAIVFSLYKPLASDDTDTVRGLMSFYKKIYMILGIFILGIGVCLMPALPYLIKGTPPAGVNIYVIYAMYLGNTCISYCFFAYKSALLEASQKLSVISNIQSIVNCARYCVQLILLVVTKNYYVFMIIMPISTFLYNTLVAFITDKRYPQYKAKGLIRESDKYDLKQQIKGLAISKICGVMRDSLDSITLSAFVSLTAVAIYGNYSYVVSAIHGMLTVISAGIRAGVGNSIVTNSKEKNFHDMLKFNYLYLIVSGWCVTCMVCLYQDFMLLWAKQELMSSNVTMVLFSIYFYSLCLSDIRNVYVEAKGLWWDFRIRSIIEASANLILNIIFVSKWGITGVMIATILTFWLINIGYGTPILFKKYFGIEHLKPYAFQCIKYTAINVIVCAFVYLGCTFVPFNGYWGLILKAIICGILALGLLLLIYRHDHLFKETSDGVKGLLRRKRP